MLLSHKETFAHPARRTLPVAPPRGQEPKRHIFEALRFRFSDLRARKRAGAAASSSWEPLMVEALRPLDPTARVHRVVPIMAATGLLSRCRCEPQPPDKRAPDRGCAARRNFLSSAPGARWGDAWRRRLGRPCSVAGERGCQSAATAAGHTGPRHESVRSLLSADSQSGIERIRSHRRHPVSPPSAVSPFGVDHPDIRLPSADPSDGSGQASCPTSKLCRP